jgi:phosphomannomutase
MLLSLLKVIDDFDYTFAENGLTAFKNGKALPSQSFIKFVGEERYKAMVKFILHYIADLDIPIKRYVAEMPDYRIWCKKL